MAVRAGVTRRSIDAAGDRHARDGDYRRCLALWQVGIVRQFGGRGWLVAAAGTIVLLAALGWVARPLVAQLRDP